MRRLIQASVLALVVIAGAHVTRADVPRKLSFQGRLLDPSGTPKNGTFTLNVRIYVGGVVCTTDTRSVQVNSGLFNYEVGGATSDGTLPAGCDFHAEAEVEVAVGTNPWMTPRIKLPAAAYAIATETVQSSTNTVLSAGHAYGNIPFSDGNANTSLNAESWQGKTVAILRSTALRVCDYPGSVNGQTMLTTATTCTTQDVVIGCPACPAQACPIGCSIQSSNVQNLGTCLTKPQNICTLTCTCPTQVAGYLRSS
jgi:hypothetical protein